VAVRQGLACEMVTIYSSTCGHSFSKIHYTKKPCDGEMSQRIRKLKSVWHMADSVLRQTRATSRSFKRSGFPVFVL
jgi:hypothetical protein